MTITTLRPNAKAIGAPDPTVTGAADSVAAVNDNSDTSYVRGSQDKGYIRYFLGDITLSATQRVRTVNVRIRNANDGTGGTTQDTLTNLNSSAGAHLGTAKFIGGLTSTRGLTTISTVTGPLCYSGPNGVAWTQAVVNDLQIQVQWFKVHYGVAGWQRVHELYVDCDVITQPSAGTVTVTNTANNARPNVAFVYSQAEGFLQYRYEIKIFDSVTYGAATFNPDTSRTVYDTGEVSGDAANFDLDQDLQQGITYKAYVKAAMYWPGPEGQAWYSTWAISSAFGISFTPPYTPTVAVNLLSDGQQYRAAIAVAAPINLLISDAASFELSTGGWVAVTNGAAPTQSTTDAADGTHSLQLSSSAAGTMVYRSPTDANGQPSVDGGVTYTALVSFHAATAGRSCNAGIRWLDITGAAIGADVYGSNVTDVTTAGVYTQASVTAAAPGRAVKAWVLAQVQSTAGAAEVHRIDKASIAVGSSTSWTPGATIDDHTLYVERGERVLARRGPADNWAHPQVASGGSVLQDPTYGFNWSTSLELLEWVPLDKAIPGGGPYGMLHWQPRDPASGVRSLRMGAAMVSPDTDWRFPVVTSQSQILSYWAWVLSGTLSVTPKIEWLDDTGAAISTTTGGAVTLTTTPQQITMTGTTPTSISGARGLLENTTGSNTADIYLTRIGWGMGTVPVDDKPAMGGPLVWTAIRFGETAAQMGLTYAPATGQLHTFNDFEMTAGRPILYRARVGIQIAGLFVVSPNSIYTSLYTTPPSRTMLRSATDPTLACAVLRSEGVAFGGPSVDISRADDAQIFHPLGRDGGPVRVRDWVGGEDGELVAVTTSEKQLQRLSDVVASSTVLQVQWARGGRSYILVTGRSYKEDLFPNQPWRDVDDTIVNPYLAYRVWSLPYVETTAP